MERKLEKLDQGKCSSLKVDVNRAFRKPQDDRANKEKRQLTKERIYGGKDMEVEIYVKHGLLKDGGLGLLRSKVNKRHP